MCQLLIRAQSRVQFNCELINQWPQPSIRAVGPALCSTRLNQLYCTEPHVGNTQISLYPVGVFTISICMHTDTSTAINTHTFHLSRDDLCVPRPSWNTFQQAVAHRQARTGNNWTGGINQPRSPPPPTHTLTHTYICNWLSHISCSVNHTTLRLGVRSTGLLRFP